MDSDSEQYKAAIANVNKINAKISELGRIGKHIKLQQKIEAQTEMIKHLQFVSDSMRKAGASEHSIQVALQGMYEYLKVAHGHKLAKSSEEIIKNPDSQYDEQTIQAPVPSSLKSNRNRLTGFGINAYPWAKSRSWTVILVWANHCFPSSSLPVSVPVSLCHMALPENKVRLLS